MGDISVIARRLSDKYIQYGWSGNGGYFSTVGARLLAWYDTPDMVEYLFGLGQLRHLWKPHSETRGSGIFRTVQHGIPHWVADSERWMFSKIMFIDYGYFYDADQVWYYVAPGPFRLKIPLTLVAENLDDQSFEFPFLRKVDRLVLDEIFSGHHTDCLSHSGLSVEELQKIYAELAQEDGSLYQLWDRYKSVFQCFDDWVLIRPDESGENVGDITLRPSEEPHKETIFW